MTPQLLPDDFDGQITAAIRAFWGCRSSAQVIYSQGGTRDSVIGGNNLVAFQKVIRSVAAHCGLPPGSVFTGRRETVIPASTVRRRHGIRW